MAWTRFFVSLDMGAKDVHRALNELENDIANDKLGEPTEARVDKTRDLINDIKEDLDEIEEIVGEV